MCVLWNGIAELSVNEFYPLMCVQILIKTCILLGDMIYVNCMAMDAVQIRWEHLLNCLQQQVNKWAWEYSCTGCAREKVFVWFCLCCHERKLFERPIVIPLILFSFLTIHADLFRHDVTKSMQKLVSEMNDFCQSFQLFPSRCSRQGNYKKYVCLQLCWRSEWGLPILPWLPRLRQLLQWNPLWQPALPCRFGLGWQSEEMWIHLNNLWQFRRQHLQRWPNWCLCFWLPRCIEWRLSIVPWLPHLRNLLQWNPLWQPPLSSWSCLGWQFEEMRIHLIHVLQENRLWSRWIWQQWFSWPFWWFPFHGRLRFWLQ